MANVAVKNFAGRQYPLYAVFDVDWSNIQDTGVAVANLLKLPPKAILIDGAIDVLVASNATTATVNLGDAALGTRYLSAVNLKTTGRTALTLTDLASLGDDLLLVPTITGVPSAGSFRIFIGYLIQDRANEAQTN